MSAAGTYRPIDADGYLREIRDGKVVLDHIVGLKADGTTCVIVREVKTVKRGLKKTFVPGAFKGYNITDLVAASGAIAVTQSTNPWTVINPASFLGVWQVIGDTTTLIQNLVLNAGATLQLFSFTKDLLIVSAVIRTSSAAGTRSLSPNPAYTSKTAAPSSLVDLLDHQIALPANVGLGVQNADLTHTSGDQLSITAIRWN